MGIRPVARSVAGTLARAAVILMAACGVYLLLQLAVYGRVTW